MNILRRRTLPFLFTGLTFLFIGLSGRRVFLYIGITFLILGLIPLVRARR